MASSKRIFLDPIHHDIVLDSNNRAQNLILKLIDTPEFQRLRRVHQFGISNLTFLGSEHSRFTHSVGVMHIASRLYSQLLEKAPSLTEYEPLILASALLHDVGHGPYSHVTEKIVGYNHEDWSRRIITEDTGITETLRNFDKQLPEKIASVLKKTFKPHYLSDIVSSQLDCDRFDYLLRDSYMSGTAYGLFALDRILASLEIDEPNDRLVVSGEKAQTAVEHYLFARYSMYASVYFHKKNLAARAQLGLLVKRARMLAGQLNFMDKPMHKWLMNEPLDVQEYLRLDDVALTYHIKRWMDDKDPILCDLASRLINRKLFKAVRLPVRTTEEVEEIQKRAADILKKANFDPEFYLTTDSTGIKPYELYHPDNDNPQSNIMLRTSNGQIKELSSLSPTVDALVKGQFASFWLIYPAEVSDKLLQALEPAKVV